VVVSISLLSQPIVKLTMVSAMSYLDVFLGRQSPLVIGIGAVVGVLLLGVIDWVSGPLYSLIIFYLAPLIAVTWYASRVVGYTLAGLSAAIWFVTQLLDPAPAVTSGIIVWNTAMRALVYAVVVALTTRLRRSLFLERELARTDPLTGLLNRRQFYVVLEAELRRAERWHRPFTLAYLDMDNFKQVNDRLGHNVGDFLLTTAATTLRSSVRTVDAVARVGGDEFVMLLVEADASAAQTVMRRVHKNVLEVLHIHGWPVSCSVGMITFDTPPDTVNSAITQADALMYEAKANGKGQVMHRVVAASAASEPLERR
jgi:diguanylate cyclase (GGDEF)-like protein